MDDSIDEMKTAFRLAARTWAGTCTASTEDVVSAAAFARYSYASFGRSEAEGAFRAISRVLSLCRRKAKRKLRQV